MAALTLNERLAEAMIHVNELLQDLSVGNYDRNRITDMAVITQALSDEVKERDGE